MQSASKQFQQKVLQRLAQGSYEGADLGLLLQLVPCDFKPKLFKRLRDPVLGLAGSRSYGQVY